MRNDTKLITLTILLFVNCWAHALWTSGSSTFQYVLEGDMITQHEYEPETGRLTFLHPAMLYREFQESWCQLDDKYFLTCKNTMPTHD